MQTHAVAVRITALALACAGIVAGCSQPDGQSLPKSRSVETPEAAHAHANGHDQAAAPVLAVGQRWATNASLRAAMNRIRESVAMRLPAYHQDDLQAAEADALAAEVKRDIQSMIANCRLAPEPDAALHVLIGRMMGALDALHANPASTHGMPQLVSVVNDYQSMFEHAGYLPLRHD